MLAIADSSPLIYLSRVGALHVLPAQAWLRVVDNPSLKLDLGLDPGETAAILLA